MFKKRVRAIIGSVLVVLLPTTYTYSQTCSSGQPPCYRDQSPMAGHGSASSLPSGFGCNCPTDNRRVITISIDSSWDSTPGHTNDNSGMVCNAR